jgi:TetR/AcrR family transcriptional repressor of nem operon
MARPPEFNRDAVLSSATQLFWRRGYSLTLVEQIVTAAGINRATLYASFGGKAALFEQALQHYFEPVQRLLGQLQASDEPLCQLQSFFELTLIELPEAQRQLGCLSVNSVCELADSDAELAASAGQRLVQVQRQFQQMLEKAHAQGQVQADPELLARWLMNVMKGLRVNAREQMPKEQLQQMINLTFQGIRHVTL